MLLGQSLVVSPGGNLPQNPLDDPFLCFLVQIFGELQESLAGVSRQVQLLSGQLDLRQKPVRLAAQAAFASGNGLADFDGLIGVPERLLVFSQIESQLGAVFVIDCQLPLQVPLLNYAVSLLVEALSLLELPLLGGRVTQGKKIRADADLIVHPLILSDAVVEASLGFLPISHQQVDSAQVTGETGNHEMSVFLLFDVFYGLF